MVRQAWRFLTRLVLGLLLLPWRYRRTLWFVLLRNGPVGVWRFLCVKVAARGERVGLQLFDPIEINAPSLTPYPYMLEIEHTTSCSVGCVHCERQWFPEAWRNKRMDREHLGRLLDQFPRLRYLGPTGEGSSFANPDFPWLLEECDRRGIYVLATDSFANLTEDQMRLLLNHSVGKVVISIDGAMKRTYEDVRRNASFDRVLQNIRLFVALRGRQPMPEIAFRFVFFNRNWKDVPLLPALVDSLLPRRLEGDDGFVEIMSLLEWEGTKDWVVELPQEDIDQTEKCLHWYGLPHAWSHPSHDPEKKRPMRQCAAWAEPYIMVDGSVLPCCACMMSNRRDWLKTHSLGNVFQQKFPQIWESERYRAFRKNVPRGTKVPILCAGCRAFDTTVRERLYGVEEP